MKLIIQKVKKAKVEVKNAYYGYQHELDELSYIVEYEVIHLDEDETLSTGEIVVQVPWKEKKRYHKVWIFFLGIALVIGIILHREKRKKVS